MRTNKYLSVRLNQKPIGVLEQTTTGKKSFFYEQGVSDSISLSMPLDNSLYEDLVCESFFGGYLPENPSVRELIGKKFGVSPHNTFSILKAIGGDCAGALSFHEMTDPIHEAEKIELHGKELTIVELEKLVNELGKNPLFLGINGMRLSLAGFQDKAAVCIQDDRIFIPGPEVPTTHILKPTHPELIDLAENEYFIMNLAKSIGIDTPNVILKKDFKKPFILVERYDRIIKNGYITRIHQEDFCQALGILSSRKYQNEGGPGFKECYQLINRLDIPAREKLKFTEIVVFNVLIGNMDAHGKNFSILHNNGRLTLAPFYDLVCTKTYEYLSQKMAMKIGKTYKSEEITRIQWEGFAQESEYNFLSLCKMIEKTAEKIVVNLDKTQISDSNTKIKAYLLSHIEQQIKLLEKQTRW